MSAERWIGLPASVVHMFLWYTVLARVGCRAGCAHLECVGGVSGGMIDLRARAKMAEAMPGSSIGRAGGC